MTLEELVRDATKLLAEDPGRAGFTVCLEGPRIGGATGGRDAAGPGYTFGCTGIELAPEETIVYLRLEEADLPPQRAYRTLD